MVSTRESSNICCPKGCVFQKRPETMNSFCGKRNKVEFFKHYFLHLAVSFPEIETMGSFLISYRVFLKSFHFENREVFHHEMKKEGQKGKNMKGPHDKHFPLLIVVGRVAKK